jgi:hypothetical protein
MYYLYIKQHNITKLKYLGFTSAKDPSNYKGSGTYWKRHIKTHGYNVTTTILLATEDKEDIKTTGVFFSKLFNIVNSNEWANLDIEEGQGVSSDSVAVKDIDGSRFRVSKADPRLSAGTLVGQTKGMLPAYDEDGNYYYVSKTDSRLLSGVLKSNNAGKIYITNGLLNKLIYPTQTIPDGWIKGISDTKNKHNKGKIWVTDGTLEKMIFKDTIIPEGWRRGRS